MKLITGSFVVFGFVLSGCASDERAFRDGKGGGCVLEGALAHAAILHENGRIELLPPAPGVPEPGIRLNLADLVEGGTVPSTLFAFSIDDRGDFLAQSNG